MIKGRVQKKKKNIYGKFQIFFFFLNPSLNHCLKNYIYRDRSPRDRKNWDNYKDKIRDKDVSIHST